MQYTVVTTLVRFLAFFLFQDLDFFSVRKILGQNLKITQDENSTKQFKRQKLHDFTFFQL